MKIKKSLLGLFSAPLLLVSCGETGPIAGLPNGGTTIAHAQGKEQINNAIQETINATSNDAIGLKIADANIDFDYGSTFTTADSKVLAETGVNLGINDFNFLGGAQGLFSRNPDDVALYTKTSAKTRAGLVSKLTDYGKELKFRMPEFEKSYKGDYAFGASIQERMMYIDVSNDDLYNTIADVANTIAKILNPTTSFDFATAYPDRKVSIPTHWDNDDFPLIEEKTFLDALLKEFDDLPENGTYLDHGDNIYSYSGRVKNSDLEDVFEELFDNDLIPTDLFENDKIFDDDMFDDNLFEDDVFEDAFDDIVFSRDSSMEFAAVFGPQGLQSVSFSSSLQGKSKHALDFFRLPIFRTATTKASFNLKIEFSYGTDVQFPALDTTEYVPLRTIVK